MSAVAMQWLFAAGLAVFLAVHLALSVALSASFTLSRVALQKLGNEFGERLLFVQRLSEARSSYLLAASILRQTALVGAILCGGLLARDWSIERPWLLALGLAAVVVVLVSEQFIARGLAGWNARLALRYSAWSVRWARFLLFPIVWLLRAWLTWWDANGQSEEQREEEQDEEVEALLEVGEREGLLEAEESEMVRGIVDLDETMVRELMTPRTEIKGVDVASTIEQARHRFVEAGHSRLPAYRGSIDNIVGVLHSRDLFRAWGAGDEQRTIASYVRPASFVPETLSAAELLPEMRQRSHLAVVVDEYGGVAGIVTLEDVLEEIVGDIRDEHEPEEVLMQEEGEGVWVVSAVVHVREIEHLFDVDFEGRDFDTVGGLVVSAFGRVPANGETIVTNDLLVEVLQADPKRVQRVRLRRAEAAAEA